MNPQITSITLARALLVGMAAQSLLGLISPDWYRDVLWVRAAWLGNDAVTLLLAVPVLLLSIERTAAGSSRAFLVLLGLVGYALYNYAFYLLGASLNPMFPMYVILVLMSAVLLGRMLLSVDLLDFAVNDVGRARVVGGFYVVLSASLACIWLALWAGYVFAGRPTPVEPDAFRLVAALDLTLMLPALMSGGLLLVRGNPWGTVVGALAGIQASLYLTVLSAGSVASIVRGTSEAPGELPIWGSLAMVTVVATIGLVRSIGASSAE